MLKVPFLPMGYVDVLAEYRYIQSGTFIHLITEHHPHQRATIGVINIKQPCIPSHMQYFS